MYRNIMFTSQITIILTFNKDLATISMELNPNMLVKRKKFLCLRLSMESLQPDKNIRYKFKTKINALVQQPKLMHL